MAGKQAPSSMLSCTLQTQGIKTDSALRWLWGEMPLLWEHRRQLLARIRFKEQRIYLLSQLADGKRGQKRLSSLLPTEKMATFLARRSGSLAVPRLSGQP